LVMEAQVALKIIMRPYAFINKEQWNVIWMKEEYHAKFVTILYIIYQQKRLAYFNNQITMTTNLTNKGKKVNWCSTMLTPMSIELTCGQNTKRKL
jgi:hypothetical protein